MLDVDKKLLLFSCGTAYIGEEGKDNDLPETAEEDAVELIDEVLERTLEVANAKVAGEKLVDSVRRCIFFLLFF